MSQPSFYAPEHVGTLYPPQVGSAIQEGIRAGLSPASDDRRRRLLLLVDEQVDFIHEDGSLRVPGAIADTRRLIEWIYRHAAEITAIAASLDSHTPIQIFFPTWWADAQGRPPDPYTPITDEDLRRGRWAPVYEPDWSIDYVKTLRKTAKKDLMIWPFHTLLGTQGSLLTPALYEAIAYHSAARKSGPEFIVKGMLPKSEYYSLLEPEVKVEQDPRGGLDQDRLEWILDFDEVYIAGQAKSHCVLETVTSVMDRYGGDRKIAEKLFLLSDCMSSVQHPEIDFEALANKTYAEFEEQGLSVIDSTSPLG